MITLERDRLTFRFPEVHEDAQCSINFQRTLRIPDDDKDYPLPPGLGSFPLRHLDDFAERVPDGWIEHGGVIMPMHQAEAMWLSFETGPYEEEYPFAIKIATGKINAVTGDSWVNHLNQDPQDYITIPRQPWLDGYCVEKGTVRQFVAMPLGEGYSVEEQVTGTAEHGGLQIIVYPMKAELYEKIPKSTGIEGGIFCLEPQDSRVSMGLAPGGRMKQKIYDDEYGLDAWDQRYSRRCFVTIANSLVWAEITGERPPTAPPTAADYTNVGLPWFDYYDVDAKALEGAEALGNLSSVAKMGKDMGKTPLPENESVEAERIIKLRKEAARPVREATL